MFVEATPGGRPADAVAVAGWSAECTPGEPRADREYAIWVAGRASVPVNALCDRLGLQLARL